METVDGRAATLGRTQRGLATRRQLREIGISAASIRRRVEAGSWREPLPTVIDLGQTAPSWERDAQALLLAAGPGAAVSHASAAHLHGFLDVVRPESVDVMVPRGRRERVGDARLRTTRHLEPRDLVEVDGLTCTAAGRTLWDLATATPLDRLERLAWDLGRRRLRSALRAAAQLVTEHPQAPGSARLREALGRVPTAAHQLGSVLEADGVRQLTNVGLAPPALQFVIRDTAGRRVRRVDAAWPDRLVAVEFDGAAYHDTATARAADDVTRATIAGLGWDLVVVRARDLHGARFEALVTHLRDLVVSARRG